MHLLRDKYRADYSLFVHLRDSYASPGRGVALEGGSQVGFASLVDLNTGDIVWINRLRRNSGDKCQASSAKLYTQKNQAAQ